jgi:hypothetical protein
MISAALPALAESPEFAQGLQSPEQRSVRDSAYSLPKGMWALEGGVLGVTGEELYGALGVKYGFGAGIQLDLNLAHYAVGLLNVSARWSFFEIPHFALAGHVAFTYGHGAWIWILGPLAKDLIEDADIINVPFGVTASAPIVDWLQLDLGVTYQYGTVFGTLGDGGNFFAEAQIGGQQFAIHPGVRLFASDATALELAFELPLYTWVPYEGEITAELRNRGFERSGEGGATMSLSEVWKFEVGVRSRLNPWLFAALRLNYGKTNKYLYSTTLNPSLSLEARW